MFKKIISLFLITSICAMQTEQTGKQDSFSVIPSDIQKEIFKIYLNVNNPQTFIDAYWQIKTPISKSYNLNLKKIFIEKLKSLNVKDLKNLSEYILENIRNVMASGLTLPPTLSIERALPSFEFAKFLVQIDKFDVEAMDSKNVRLLLRAIQADQRDLVVELIKKRANVNKQKYDQVNPLTLAIALNRVQIAKSLINAGAKSDISEIKDPKYLEKALLDRNIELANFLIDNGADINRQDYEGHTLLSKFITTGRYEEAIFLIEHGAQLNTESKYGWTSVKTTPLDEAEIFLNQSRGRFGNETKVKGYEKLVDLLKSKGAKSAKNPGQSKGTPPIEEHGFYERYI